MIMQLEYYQFPKWLFTLDISSDSKLLYMLLLDRYKLSLKNNFIDENNRVYIFYSRDSVEKELNISHPTCINLFKQLKTVGLLEEKKQGRGKANIIYLKSIDINSEIKKLKNLTSRSKEIELLDVKNINPNKNDISKKELSNIVVDEKRFIQAIKIEKARMIEAYRSDEFVNKAIKYAIKQLNNNGPNKIKIINSFSDSAYIDLFNTAFSIVSDDITVSNIDNNDAYFSFKIQKYISLVKKKGISHENYIC